MAIGDVFQDGSHKFGILNPTLKGALQTKGYTIESFTRNLTTNRVDLNDGAGSPSGAVTVPQREEASFTIQIGSDVTMPSVGDIVTADNGATYYTLTEVSVSETQEDFVRANLSGFKQTSTPRPIFFRKFSGGEDFQITSVLQDTIYGVVNLTSQSATTITSTTNYNVMNAYVGSEDSTKTYQIQITPSSGTFQIGSSTANDVVTIVAGGSYIRFSMVATATQAQLTLRYS